METLRDGQNWDAEGNGISVTSGLSTAHPVVGEFEMARVETWPTGAVPDGTYRITDNGNPDYRQVWMDVKLPGVPQIVHFRLMDVIGDVPHAALRTWDGNADAPTLEEPVKVKPHGVEGMLFHGVIRGGRILAYEYDGSSSPRE